MTKAGSVVLIVGLGLSFVLSVSSLQAQQTKTMTFNMGDPPSRHLMNLDPGEMYCFIHYDLLPLIVDNFENISEGHVT